ncbi:hypothetical protein [Flavobacterium sp. K5-23]|uniref:hypothetical protein n=1 Tax=Flavobacterium sp. K5-23 TaxID=2746225 RepID=UPI00200CFECB|nr:hypothetical protein [Flavobacterium sp. K5-23]UQD57517.1 hypothetical protein FLAK523_14380 [Flavobacterium sp. K5-23]
MIFAQNLKLEKLSDFEIIKMDESIPKSIPFSFGQGTRKEPSQALKLVALFATFCGFIYLSINNGNLFLFELVVGGGIVSIAFFILQLSNRQSKN